MPGLRSAVGGAPFVFVAGKGGVGKTTAAGALALELADGGEAVHLISTDPAHSLGDLFGVRLAGIAPSPCSARLVIEEFAAETYAQRWLERAAPGVSEIVERGSWLDAEDVAGFTRLALPGVDELMAVLRLVELADGARTVVDTAPTGHTLRLLDAASAHAALARALRAMAAKASAVASSFAGRRVRLAGESIIEELERSVAAYDARVLRAAAFVLVEREHAVVRAETERLAAQLEARGLRIAARVRTAAPEAAPSRPVADRAAAAAAASAEPRFVAPWLADATRCDGLRRWRSALRRGNGIGAGEAASGRADARAPREGCSAAAWLRGQPCRLLVFAGKGGVGKTTCAAAAAVVLAADRDVLLCSADPAGSLEDVLGGGEAVPRLRPVQVDGAARLEQLREEYRDELLGALASVGIPASAALDRQVIEALWDLTPPGIDEFAALAWILGSAGGSETIVLDTAPTGHFLRLLAMPQLALDWTRQLMRLIVKYRAAGAVGGAAEALLQTARELRALQELLRDRERTGVVVVTLDEPLVRAETDRLLAALRDAEVAITAVLHNRAGSTGDPAPPGAQDAGGERAPLVRAPLRSPPPVGAVALREFAGAWKIEL